MDSVGIVYVVTAVVGVGVAVLLFHLTKLQTQARFKIETKGKDRYSEEEQWKLNLRKTVFNEMGPFVGTREARSHLTDVVSEVVDREVEKRVAEATQDIIKKYQDSADKTAGHEEVAWNKYKKVLTDKRKTEAVLRSIAQGLVVVDSKGKVVMMNPAAEQLLGTSQKDKVGKSILSDLKEEQLVSMADGEDKEIELTTQDDETKKILRASSAVIEDENGETVGMVSMLSDITKQKELDRLKTGFVANVSHELRTPIVAVEKSLSLILSKATGEVTKDQEQFLGIAERNLKRLNLLINDLLDLSKLEAGKMEFNPKATEIGEVIGESVDTLENWALTKSITIEKDIHSGLPKVHLDPNRVIQVLNNLIGNAIKYTPDGGKVTVAAVFDKGKDSIEVSVQDTGIGISKEDLPKVFDKFYQVGERVSTDIAGTGIGLSVAKEIVRMHGGEIWVESEKNRGTRFIFTLPLS